jgi:hypothetical protein
MTMGLRDGESPLTVVAVVSSSFDSDVLRRRVLLLPFVVGVAAVGRFWEL